MLMSDAGALFDFVLVEPPRRQHRCPTCRDTDLVIGERAPTTRDALEWGAWLLNRRLCECTGPGPDATAPPVEETAFAFVD